MSSLCRGLTQRTLMVIPAYCPSPSRRSPSLARGTFHHPPVCCLFPTLDIILHPQRMCLQDFLSRDNELPFSVGRDCILYKSTYYPATTDGKSCDVQGVRGGSYIALPLSFSILHLSTCIYSFTQVIFIDFHMF